MTFHILTANWITDRITGREMYHYNLDRWLQSEGHQCSHGPKIPPEADTVITTPFPHYHEAMRSGKRVVFLQHNDNREPYNFEQARVIYCAKHVAKLCNYKAADSVIFPPFNRYAGTPYRGNPIGEVLLMNCNENKGGKMLYELAVALPKMPFAAINGGYGKQRLHELPNLHYTTPMFDASPLYRGAMALLLLSKREGLPTVALEAMSHGVPVVGFDIPGIREACGEYVFPNLSAVQKDLVMLREDPDYYYARSVVSVARAKEVEEARDWVSLRRILGIN